LFSASTNQVANLSSLRVLASGNTITLPSSFNGIIEVILTVCGESLTTPSFTRTGNVQYIRDAYSSITDTGEDPANDVRLVNAGQSAALTIQRWSVKAATGGVPNTIVVAMGATSITSVTLDIREVVDFSISPTSNGYAGLPIDDGPG
jgi:hypothetical protein